MSVELMMAAHLTNDGCVDSANKHTCHFLLVVLFSAAVNMFVHINL